MISVIKIKLDDLLKKRKKTLYAVARETGIAYNNLARIKKGESTGITFDVLEKLCVNLDCKPNDLLEIAR